MHIGESQRNLMMLNMIRKSKKPNRIFLHEQVMLNTIKKVKKPNENFLHEFPDIFYELVWSSNFVT